MPRGDDPITVSCATAADGWQCAVKVAGQFAYIVDVSRQEIERFAPGSSEPSELVERSFRFLLEREPRSSILGRFGLSTIERYFPEYEEVITRPTDRPEPPA